MIRPLTVRLGTRSYSILIGEGLLDQVGPLARKALGSTARRVALITNTTVNKLYGERVSGSLTDAGFRVFEASIKDGERFKTLGTAEKLFDSLIEQNFERSDAIVALGGGVVGDLAGFVAATFLRGIRFVQVPTTLLAQIDSSVGGKTGVNHRLGKNLIGSFHQPSLVVIDPATLRSLPERELSAGMFEAVKYGVIRDFRLFQRIDKRLESIAGVEIGPTCELIRRCCAIKAEVVREDERESGLRRILNFGHTVGHALESATKYKRFLHGEAVGLGMIAESLVSRRMGLLGTEALLAITALVTRVGTVPSASTLAFDDIISAMVRDKKTQAGRLVFVLPVEIGRVTIRSDVPLPVVKKALSEALS